MTTETTQPSKAAETPTPPEPTEPEIVTHAVTAAYRKREHDIDLLLAALAGKAAQAHSDYVSTRDRTAGMTGMAGRDARVTVGTLHLLWLQANEVAAMARCMLGRDVAP